MKNKPAIYLLICALSFAQPASSDEFSNMFSIMFRMMFSMMDAMSDVMGENSNDSGWGGANSVGMGMTALPVMGGMSPWSGMGGMPMNSMGMTPWNSPMMGNPASNPFFSGYNPSMFPGYNNNAYANPNYRYPARTGAAPHSPSALLNGRWFGDAGDILEVRGNQFRIKDRQSSINGTVRVENNVVSLIVPRTGGVSRYTFARNQSELILQDATGQILIYRQRPVNRAVRTF